MPGELQAVYYRAADGSQPVDAFIDGLPATHQVAIDNEIEHVLTLSQIDGELHELRCRHDGVQYAIFYRRSRTLIVLLHIVRNDGGQVPEAALAIARERQEDFRARMRASRIVPGDGNEETAEMLSPIGDRATGRTRRD